MPPPIDRIDLITIYLVLIFITVVSLYFNRHKNDDDDDEEND